MSLLRLFSSVKFLLLLSMVIVAYSFVSENEAVKPVFKLEWDNVNGWHYPQEFSDFPDGLTRLTCKVELEDGNEALVLMSDWHAKTKIAKLLIWNGQVPDYGNIGDGNPHPSEYWIIDYELAESLCDGRN